MRVVVLSQYYDPEPVPKPGEVARELIQRGHHVTVLTGLPNYPSGRLAAGYRLAPFSRERLDEVPIIRVFEVPYHGTSAAGRILNYGSFMLSSSIAAGLLRGRDVAYVWHPPLTVGIPAALLARVRSVPFVYDVQDIWPESAVFSGMLTDERLVRALRRLEQLVYARAAHILVPTEEARTHIVSRGVPMRKISVLPNWADPSDYEADPASRAKASQVIDAPNCFVVTYAGNLGRVQGLDSVLEAARRLRYRQDIAWRIAGAGSDGPRLERLAREMHLDNVRFLGRLPSTEMPALFAESDALLVHLRSGPLADLVVPSKTQAYLAAGRPIVMASRGPAARIVEAAGAGLIVPPDDPERLAGAVAQLSAVPASERQEIGDRGRSYAKEHYSRSKLMSDLESLLAAVAVGREPG